MRERQVKPSIILTGRYAYRKIKSTEDIEMRESILMNLLVDVTDVFDVPLKTTLSPDRQHLAVLVRSIYYLVSRIKTDYGLVPIGDVVGGRDHTGVIFHLNKVQGYLNDSDAEFLVLWNYYLNNSKLFTPNDFVWNE